MKSKLLIALLMGIFSFRFGGGAEQPSAKQSSGPVESKEEKAQRQNNDRLVINALRNAGANLSKHHTLEHHFVTDDRAKADAVIADELATGYAVSKVSTLNDKSGKPYYYFDLIKAVVPEEETVFAESLRMKTLGRKHGVLYDGWGCEVKK